MLVRRIRARLPRLHRRHVALLHEARTCRQVVAAHLQDTGLEAVDLVARTHPLAACRLALAGHHEDLTGH